ncbi:MAG: hypothetical protein D6741_09630, partial [Planctomycetota bacterium]
MRCAAWGTSCFVVRRGNIVVRHRPNALVVVDRPIPADGRRPGLLSYVATAGFDKHRFDLGVRRAIRRTVCWAMRRLNQETQHAAERRARLRRRESQIVSFRKEGGPAATPLFEIMVRIFRRAIRSLRC